MKKITYLFLLFISVAVFSQENDSTTVFKKRVLESTEVDFFLSYYKQDGIHSAVSGGIGSEDLTDIASNIVVAMPMNADDVLTIDVGISAYTSASSSNINPFNGSGASGGGGDDRETPLANSTYGTPWQASSGASAQDQLVNLNASYSHSSNDRNFIWSADINVSNEYDYTSIGFGGGITKLYNQKNTEFSLKGNVYLDQWRPIYPTELHEFSTYGVNFQNEGYFRGITVYNQNGQVSSGYLPDSFNPWDSVNRNSYSLSFSFSQIITNKMQFSLFFDIVKQEGLLSTPYHRIYFADKENFYIGNLVNASGQSNIANYENNSNTGIYRLADDSERLPGSRIKLPVGLRLNYYANEFIKIRTYYRYYVDDWGIQAHTANIELPIKINDKFTVYPMYRYYIQTASKYFAPFEKHLSTERYYTSDYDLSKFNSNQYGFGITYVDIFTNFKIWKAGLKSIDFRFNHYDRSDTLVANIASINFKFIVQ